MRPPLQGFNLLILTTQGDALGWYDTAPLVLGISLQIRAKRFGV